MNGLNEAFGTSKCMIASAEGRIRDLTWRQLREAAGAGVRDLEHVCPCKPETICIAHKDMVHGEAMCPAALQQPPPPASATSSCQQQLLHSGTALQQLLPGDVHPIATRPALQCQALSAQLWTGTLHTFDSHRGAQLCARSCAQGPYTPCYIHAGMTQLVGCIAVSDDHAWRHSSVGVAGAGAAVARLLRLHV